MVIELPILVARIDDRLIHGTITCKWINKYDFDRIIVLNDEAASNQFMVEMLSLAASVSSSVNVSVLALKDGINKIKAREFKNEKVMIITKRVKDMLSLLQGGVKLDWVNIGQIGGKTGRKNIIRGVSVSEEEAKMCWEMAKYVNGKVIFQQVTEEKPLDFLKLLEDIYPEKI